MYKDPRNVINAFFFQTKKTTNYSTVGNESNLPDFCHSFHCIRYHLSYYDPAVKRTRQKKSRKKIKHWLSKAIIK